MPNPTPPFPQNPDHANGTCEQCGQPCAVCGPRWCPDCYAVDGVPRDLREFIEREQAGPSLMSVMPIDAARRNPLTRTAPLPTATEHAPACPPCGQSVQSLGRRIRECRAAKNWTRAQAAEQVGVTAARWALWEDDHARPPLEDLAALTVLFEVEPAYFAAAFPVTI